jgi:hypothetical protein
MARRRHAKKSHSKCLVRSGAKKGRLKKGYRFNRRGQCVRSKKK